MDNREGAGDAIETITTQSHMEYPRGDAGLEMLIQKLEILCPQIKRNCFGLLGFKGNPTKPMQALSGLGDTAVFS